MNIEDTRNEIIKRTVALRQEQQKKTMRALEVLEAALIIALIVVIQYLPNSKAGGNNAGYYGTLALESEVGLFIIVGIICFLMGVIITLITVKMREKNKMNK